MKERQVILRAAAKIDVIAAIDHYVAEAGQEVAQGFVDALNAAYSHIAGHPGTGSPRYAVKLNLGGLRFWSLGRYPYLVFYFPLPDRIDVVRVLHEAMDVSRALDMGNDGRYTAQEPLAAYEFIAEWE